MLSVLTRCVREKKEGGSLGDYSKPECVHLHVLCSTRSDATAALDHRHEMFGHILDLAPEQDAGAPLVPGVRAGALRCLETGGRDEVLAGEVEVDRELDPSALDRRAW